MKNNYKLYGIIVLGFCLTLIQFASNRSLWLDEAKLAYSIIDRDFLGLLAPLDSGQMAPILYLWITKCFNYLFGDYDLALRIFPLLCFLVSIVLVVKWSALLVKNKTILLIITALYCLCPTLIYYSSEVKQYSTDVMVFLLLLYCYFKDYKTQKSKWIVLSLVGVLAVTLSNVSIIVFFVLGLYTLVFEVKNLKTLVIPFSIWLLAFSAYYFTFLHQHPSRALMKNYWEFAFMPINPFSIEFWQWSYKAITLVFTKLLGFSDRFYFYILIIIFYCIGIVSLLKKKNYKLLFILTVPIIVHLLLSSLKLYPFFTRIILYQVPLYFITIAIGMYYIYKKVEKHIHKSVAVLGLLLPFIVFSYINAKKMPFLKEHIKPIYSYMNTHVKPEDKVYVFIGNYDVFDYYKKINYINFNNVVIQGESHHYDYTGHDQQLSKLKGKVWFVFSHVFKSGNTGELESRYIIDYYKDKAETLYKIEEGTNAAYLLDIK
ncbi:glycosyltransferase family 39 protein [uncultured Lacinutrix sp.]|uniref:glycosyltransferase family 39 protein n=1 Tax=uncultured Lacinutrix sp. TaxID=574032 RepID=UPI00261FA35E|nr:glycosyltransferase family 39 protein [uncultured Lacinutrix sp.]